MTPTVTPAAAFARVTAAGPFTQDGLHLRALLFAALRPRGHRVRHAGRHGRTVLHHGRARHPRHRCRQLGAGVTGKRTIRRTVRGSLIGYVGRSLWAKVHDPAADWLAGHFDTTQEAAE